MRQSEIYDEIKNKIPEELWNKYNYESFGEMAEEPELAEWKEELEAAEEAWWLADDA